MGVSGAECSGWEAIALLGCLRKWEPGDSQRRA